ncbi:hypothetical protein KA005_78825 [bacterium]|nr:hypothetical protein [bacterium]
MSRIIKISGITMVLTAILMVFIAGTVLAAGGNPDKGNQGEVCPFGECVCGDCVPNDYNWDWSYASQGPNGAQNGKVLE